MNTGTVSSVVKVGASFVWTVVTTNEEEPNWTQFINGQLSVGGGVPMVITAAVRATGTFTTSACSMPFRLTDDDTVTTMHLPDDRLMAAKYNPAYIQPLSDGGGGSPTGDYLNVPFSLNVVFSNTAIDAELNKAGAFESDGLRAPAYWVAYVLQGFQGQRYYFDPGPPVVRFGDGDADAEGFLFGQNGGTGNGSPSQRGAILFLETLQDYARFQGWTAAQASTHQQRVMVHEVGHQFNLMPGGLPEDNPGLGSIMDYSHMNNLAVDPGFVGVQLHGIRSTINPGR